jgi:hypothetical protein
MRTVVVYYNCPIYINIAAATISSKKINLRA